MARLPVCLCAVLLAAGPLRADDTPKPNTLTPKEVADGWLLLFDGETTFGWKIDGDAAAKDGALVLGGQKAASATLTTRFGSFDLKLETAGGVGSVVFRSAGESAALGLTNQPTALDLKFRVDGKPGGDSSSMITVGPGGLVRNTAEVTAGAPAPLRIEAQAGTPLTIKSIKLKPVGTAPLFNGKDLAGWKVFAGEKYKSKFEVTPGGELHVTNGPGDLQTEKAFDNFVLQLECKTNGKALNSGVFFRCLPDQYQNGYEMQIQNAYKDNDRTKPADFGTGAIYRRVPARKVVSNDNEWFTMTLIADGTHLATWVNGVQVVDWTDDRPADENPRKGSKTGKGHLSLQGHDPTTDLLFRNIRIAELPART
jgi:hypothetical protein